ncbi:hypothetical protein [Pseudoramibacter alactolyticus]
MNRYDSPQQRRALNIIWSAAGQYDLDPPFMALGEGDAVDFYLNIVIGLSLKWLDPEEMALFFASYPQAAKAPASETLV